MSTISPFRAPGIELPAEISRPTGGLAGQEFRSLLAGAIQRVEDSRAVAEQSVNAFVNGDTEELHSVVLNTQRAELELELFLQMRNKVVQAYQEIMRMQI